MNDRVELLKRWSELAPEECQVDGDYWRFKPQQIGHFINDGFVLPALILSALIEAIRARGWKMSLEFDGKSPEVTGFISTGNGRHAAGRWNTEPCDALLACYVSCLEAVRDFDTDMIAS